MKGVIISLAVLVLIEIPACALEMVLVEGGTFLMASDSEDLYAPQPIHHVGFRSVRNVE